MKKAMKNKVLFLILALFSFSKAQAKDIRFLMLLGLGEAVSTSAGSTKETRSEKPGAMAFAIDQNFNGPFFILAEHMRSMGSTGSSIGSTGVGLKYYPWLSSTYERSVSLTSNGAKISNHGLSPYIGGGLGFAQASILGNGSTTFDVLAVTGYFSIKTGIEYSINEDWGLIGEWNFASSLAGAGRVQMLNLLFGTYYKF